MKRKKNHYSLKRMLSALVDSFGFKTKLLLLLPTLMSLDRLFMLFRYWERITCFCSTDTIIAAFFMLPCWEQSFNNFALDKSNVDRKRKYQMCQYANMKAAHLFSDSPFQSIVVLYMPNIWPWNIHKTEFRPHQFWTFFAL